MNIQTKFNSNENKRILWEIMIENNVFKDIPEKYANNIKAEFETSLQQLIAITGPSDNILELNKKIIRHMMERVKTYHTPIPTQSSHVPVTSSEVLTKKQAQFQKGLQTKQDEFNRLIQPVKPQSIDFSDKNEDEPIGSEMDLKLSQTIAWREQQLSQVLEKQNPVDASEWINNGKKVSASANVSANANTNSNLNTSNTNTNTSNTNVSNNSNISTNTNMHIKIGNPTKMDDSNIINLKKVSFMEDSITTPAPVTVPFNFMDKLKKKDGLEDLNLLKTDIAGLQTNIIGLQTDIELMKTNMNKLLADNKLILENQEKIMDKIEQVAFQTGSI